MLTWTSEVEAGPRKSLFSDVFRRRKPLPTLRACLEEKEETRDERAECGETCGREFRRGQETSGDPRRARRRKEAETCGREFRRAREEGRGNQWPVRGDSTSEIEVGLQMSGRSERVVSVTGIKDGIQIKKPPVNRGPKNPTIKKVTVPFDQTDHQKGASPL